MATEGYILYRGGYKYQLAADYKAKISIRPESNIKTEFIDLDTDGNLLIRRGYACDGPSGPVKDTKKNLRASFEHDALYQLMRQGYLDSEFYREAADMQFIATCKIDKVCRLKRFLDYRGLRRFAAFAADPKNKKVILRAPNES